MRSIIWLVVVAFLAGTTAAAAQHTPAIASEETDSCKITRIRERLASEKALRQKMPLALLDRLQRAIEFALDQGAAREISEEDLSHAHILAERKRGDLDKTIADGRGVHLLLHAQEETRYGADYEKRNVLASPGGKNRILPCSIGQYMLKRFPASAGNKQNSACTITETDLKLKHIAQVRFFDITDCSPQNIANYPNMRLIRGRKILFVFVWVIV